MVTTVIILTVLIFILVVIFIRKRNGQNFPPFLTWAMIISTFTTIAYVIYYFIPAKLQTFVFYLSSIMILLAFFFLYLHYESLLSERHLFLRFLLIFGIFISCLTLHVVIFLNLYNDLIMMILLIDILSSFYGAVIMIFAVKVVYDTYKLTKEKATRNEIVALFLIIIAGFLYLIAVIFIYSENPYLVSLGIEFQNLSYLVIFGGLFILMINYVINKDYIFRLPFPILQIMLVNGKGALVYNKQTSSKKIPELNPTNQLLFSGYIQAISNMIEKILGTDLDLNRIESGEYKIFFSRLPKKQDILVVIAMGGNYFLQKSIEHFSSVFPKEILEKIQGHVRLEKETISKIDKFLKFTFPYLEIKE